MGLIWLNRFLNLIVALGTLIGMFSTADQVPPKLRPWAAAFLTLALWAGKYAKTPSQAMAAAAPVPKGPGALGLLPLLFLGALAGLFTSCAHQQAITDGLEGVALDCGKEVEPAILNAAESVAAQPSKETALAQAEILAGKVGWCVTSKGLAFVLNELTTRHASSEPGTLNKVTNLQAVLDRHPVPAN